MRIDLIQLEFVVCALELWLPCLTREMLPYLWYTLLYRVRNTDLEAVSA